MAAGVPAAARSGITMPYFKHDPPQDGSVLQRRTTAIVGDRVKLRVIPISSAIIL